MLGVEVSGWARRGWAGLSIIHDFRAAAPSSISSATLAARHVLGGVDGAGGATDNGPTGAGAGGVSAFASIVRARARPTAPAGRGRSRA